jgi:hypothetical protein
VIESPNPSIWYNEVNLIIRNQVDDIALMHGICHVSKGKRGVDFSTMIFPKRSAFVKVKASHMLAGCVKCCLVYELIYQRYGVELVMKDYQVFISVWVLARPLIKKYKASVVMFTARNGRFADNKDGMKRLQKGILRNHRVNNTNPLEYAINSRTLRLKAVFHPGRQTSIEVTLEKTIGHVNNSLIPYQFE